MQHTIASRLPFAGYCPARYAAPVTDAAENNSPLKLVAQTDELDRLLARVAKQDQAAFAQLYDATSARVYGLALRIVRKPDVAEEVTSDAFFQIWRQAARFDAARGSPLAWMLTIVRSRALDHLRRREPVETHADPTLLQPETSTQDDAADVLHALDRRNALYEAITELAPTARQLIGLAFLRGLSHQEIAHHTGMPLGTVKTVLRNAMRSLRPRLALVLEQHE